VKRISAPHTVFLLATTVELLAPRTPVGLFFFAPVARCAEVAHDAFPEKLAFANKLLFQFGLRP